MGCDRHVCLKDLINYLKKNEYLSGYTPIEQKEVRKNIGAISADDLAQYNKARYVELTYEELNNYVQSKSLEVGTIYNITDFQTIYQSNVKLASGRYQTWGYDINPSKVYQVISIALAPDILSNDVLIVSEDFPDSENWTVKYNCKQETLSDGKKTKGKIIYLKDANNNVASYDFKNVKFRRTKEQLAQLGVNIEEDYKDLYTFNTSTFEDSSDTYNVYNNLFYSNCTNNVFIGNSCYNNIFRGGFKNNTFVSHCYNNEFKFNTFNNNFKDPVTYLSGGFDNLDFIDRNITANDIDKKIYKSNKEYVISYIDPDTLALQTFKL